jgi:hypothetical protein
MLPAPGRPTYRCGRPALWLQQHQAIPERKPYPAGRPRFVFARIPSGLDELSAEVLLGGEGIVGVAAQREIVRSVLAAPREGSQVV